MNYRILLLLCSSTLLSSCTFPWDTPKQQLPLDTVETSFPSDLAWVHEYPYSHSTIPLKDPPSSAITWVRFKHPTIPIQFAYPKSAHISIKEIDLDYHDYAIDLVINPSTGERITIVLQKNITYPSNIPISEMKTIQLKNFKGTYYKARNMKNSQVSLEKFIAKIPNSRYGIHITGTGYYFQTLISTLELR